MIKDQIRALVQQINTEKDDELRDITLQLLEKSLNFFPQYLEKVYMMEIQVPILYAKYEGENLKDKIADLDENRRLVHNCVIDACGKLNRLCDKYMVERFCPDTVDRQEVADFCAQITTELFLSGIGKDQNTIDAVIEAMDNHGVCIQKLDFEEQFVK